MGSEYAGFWARVQRLREVKGLTFKELASYTSTNDNVIKSSMSKLARPSVSLALELAKGLNTTAEYLLTGQMGEQEAIPEDAVEVAMLYNNLTPENKEFVQKTLAMLTSDNK